MTEKEFLKFMKKAWIKGRVSQISGRIDIQDHSTQKLGEYISGHAVLPRDYDKISEEDLTKMAILLFQKKLQIRLKRPS